MAICIAEPEPDGVCRVWVRPRRQQFVQSRIHPRIDRTRNFGESSEHLHRTQRRSSGTSSRAVFQREEACTCPSSAWPVGHLWAFPGVPRLLRKSDSARKQIHPASLLDRFVDSHRVARPAVFPTLPESLLPLRNARNCDSGAFGVGHT